VVQFTSPARANLPALWVAFVALTVSTGADGLVPESPVVSRNFDNTNETVLRTIGLVPSRQNAANRANGEFTCLSIV
jgi:hypothetical protein